MANLTNKTITTVLNLQRRLLQLINQATAAGQIILEEYGETEATIIALNPLQNVREQATSYYIRLYRLLLQIAESQPVATSASLNLLAQSIEETQAIADAGEASVQEAKSDFFPTMTQQPQPPDLEKVKQKAAKLREICTMFDAQITVLDELIAQVETENRNNPINVYRREKGKRLLESLMQEKVKEQGGE